MDFSLAWKVHEAQRAGIQLQRRINAMQMNSEVMKLKKTALVMVSPGNIPIQLRLECVEPIAASLLDRDAHRHQDRLAADGRIGAPSLRCLVIASHNKYGF